MPDDQLYSLPCAALLDEASRHPAVLSVRRRVANLTGYPEGNLEPLQLVRCTPLPAQEAHPRAQC